MNQIFGKDNSSPVLKAEKRNISIRNSTVLIFVIAITIIIVSVGIMIFTSWFSSAQNTIKIISEDMNRSVDDQISDIFDTPEYINESNQKLISDGMIDLSNESLQDKFFVNVLQTYKNDIYSFSYGKENGEYYGARVDENGEIQIVRNNSNTQGQSWYYSVNSDMTAGKLIFQTDLFDVRTRDWYRVAKEKRRPTYSPIYKHFVLKDLTISYACPIYDRNMVLQGVLGTHIILSHLDLYLKDIVNSKDASAVIYEKDTGHLVANSLGQDNFTIEKDGTVNRYSIDALDNQTLQNAYQHYIRTLEPNFQIKNKGTISYISVSEYMKSGLDWMVITEVSNQSLIDEIHHNIINTIIFVLLAVIVSAFLCFAIISRLYKPIYKLADAAEKISNGELSQRVDIVRKDELGIVAGAFNNMAEKMSQLINSLELKVKERTHALEQANDNLNKVKDSLYLILDSTAEGIFGIDNEGLFTFCNNSCLQLLGYENQSELLGKNIHQLIHHSNIDGSPASGEDCSILKSLWNGTKLEEEYGVFWRKDGTYFEVEYHSHPQYKNNMIIGSVVTFLDVSLKKKDAEQIKYLSSHDFLTGLLNRRSFEKESLALDTPDNLPISIIFADLNGLKLINDVFGHTQGDLLIKKSSLILSKACRSNDIVARIGGDEFIVLLPKTTEEEAKSIVDRVRSEATRETVNGVKCSMAVGYDTKTMSAQSFEAIMGNAESEMYKEKLLSKKLFGSDTIQTIMASLHQKYPSEKEHSEHIAAQCERLGKTLGLREADITALKDAGYLHDIGKIVLDETTLEADEIAPPPESSLLQHPAVGYRILKLFDHTIPLAEGVYSHHENWDGTGYPRGLQKDEIPLFGRIIAIAEYYDKLQASHKPVVQTMQGEAGKRFDPILLQVFLDTIQGEE